MNRGELKHFIEIWEEEESTQDDDIDELGERKINKILKAKVLAKKEFRGGGLLTGRPADTVLSKTTHKFTYVYNEYPDLTAERNWIKYNGIVYNVLYVLNEDDKNEFLQVFTEETEYR